MTTPHHPIPELEKDILEIMVLLNRRGDLDFGLVRRQVLLVVILREIEQIDNKPRVAVVVGVEVEVDGVRDRDLEAQVQALHPPIHTQLPDLGLHLGDSHHTRHSE